jgi:hypothetical protein
LYEDGGFFWGYAWLAAGSGWCVSCKIVHTRTHMGVCTYTGLMPSRVKSSHLRSHRTIQGNSHSDFNNEPTLVIPIPCVPSICCTEIIVITLYGSVLNRIKAAMGPGMQYLLSGHHHESIQLNNRSSMVHISGCHLRYTYH